MLKKKSLFLILLFVFFLFINSCSKTTAHQKKVEKPTLVAISEETFKSEEDSLLTKIKKKLNKDFIVVLLFLSKEESRRMASDPRNEIYPVWSRYFNNFIFSFSEEIVIYHVSLQEGKKIFNEKIPDSKYSTLFLKKNNYLYFSKPIIKKNTYKGIEAIFNNRQIFYSDFGIPQQGNKGIMQYLGIKKIKLDILQNNTY